MTFEQLMTKIKTSRYEHFGAVFFDRVGERIGHMSASTGEQKEVTINVPSLLQAALDVGAHAIVLMHSHPQQYNPRPSGDDLLVTSEINRRSTAQVNIPVIDHVIYGANDSRFSFVENDVAI